MVPLLPVDMPAETLDQVIEIFQHAHIGMLVTNAAAEIIAANESVCAITGYTRLQLLGQKTALFKSGEHSADFYQEMWGALSQHGFWGGEICNRHKNGNLYQEQLSIAAIRDSSDQITHYVAVFSDITRHKLIEEQMRHMAHFDPLTGLPNRLLLGDRLEQAIAINRRANTLLAICFLDLDGFKYVNDTLGHQAGDLMLQEVSRRIINTLRGSDTVARLGGDEFVVLISGLSSETECCLTLDRLLTVIAKPYVLVENTHSEISASIGVTIYPLDDADADTLVRHADHAMYAAKHAGKNCYQLFDSHMEQRIQARQDTLRRVERALRTEQFELHYQPKVDFSLGKVIGVEALIRWNHPILGSLSPNEFIPLLEDDDLALSLGEWVIGEALRQNRIWHEQGIDLQVSVNIFPKQLQRPNFAEIVASIIAANWPDMPPGKLQVEMLETNTAKELESIQNAIEATRKIGVRFSLDDFGTGHSSLNCLRTLKVDEIKIYQAFVHDMLSDSANLSIIKGVIGLGQAFGLQVVAEGVETREHIARLLELGCTIMQGYGISYPLPATRVSEWLANFSMNSLRSLTK